jgi:glutamate-1-semialdehyde 2,1-aminomutase
MSTHQSKKLFVEAKKLIPGGVNSPVRAFGSVGGHPIFIERAFGPYLTDVDQNNYIDYVGSWGPMIAGHAHPQVITAIQNTAAAGSSFGAPCPLEVDMARLLVKRIPSLEKVRMVNSGTEAVMGALRVARGYTGKNKILKFTGCYHGHADYLLVKAGSGALTHGRPDSLGVPREFSRHTLLAPYNDLAAVSRVCRKNRKDLAAIIVEPIAGNMGVILPKPGFLRGLKKISRETGALLVFDEVMTGFRVHAGGAQSLYHVRPDLTVLGKIIGGGLPVGAYGGKARIMRSVSPEGGVYQAGTLSGNPVAMAAGIATLKLLSSSKVYERLLEKTRRLAKGLRDAARAAKISVQVPYACGMLSLYFSSKKVNNLTDAQNSKTKLFGKFFHEMLSRGIYLPPSPYEAWFISLAHGENEIATTLRAAKDSFQYLQKNLR